MNCPLTFRVHEEIPPDEAKILFDRLDWGDSGRSLQCRAQEIHIIGYGDGRPATHIGLTRQQVLVGTSEVIVGGVGGVVTTPVSQGKGYCRASLREAAIYMQTNMGVGFGLLFCRDQLLPLYGSAGWQKIDAPVYVNQPSGKVKVPSNTMVLEFDEPWPPGTVNIDSLPW